MTLDDAEILIDEYGRVLEHECSQDGVAHRLSRLRTSPTRIMQAMKLVLANDALFSRKLLSDDIRNAIGTVHPFFLPFVSDSEAERLNTIKRDFRASDCAGLPPEEFKRRTEVINEVHEWSQNAMFAGVKLRGELTAFVDAINQFKSDPLYWQRVYALLGVVYPYPQKKHSLWDRLISSRT